MKFNVRSKKWLDRVRKFMQIKSKDDSKPRNKYLNIITSKLIEQFSSEGAVYKNIAWLFFEHIFKMLIGLFVGVWIARYLGPENYGMLNYAIAYISIFSIVSKAGLDSIVMRELSIDNTEKDKIMGTAFILKILFSFAMILACIITVHIINPNDSQLRLLIIIISISMIFQTHDIFEFWFRTKVRSKLTVVAKNTVYFIMAIIRIFLLVLKADILSFVIAITVESSLLFIALTISYYIDGNKLSRWRISLRSAKKMLSDSWPLILSGMVIMVYMRIDQLMINRMVGNIELGKYSAAVRLSEYWSFIPVIIMHSKFSSLADKVKKKEQAGLNELQNLSNLMVYIGYIVAIPIMLFSNKIINVLYGREYFGAGIILSIYVWSGVFTNLTIARNAYLSIINKTKLHFLTSVIGATLNVLLNLYLIPRYGGTGAAFATLISYSIHSYFISFLIPDLRNLGKIMTFALFHPFILAKKIFKKTLW